MREAAVAAPGYFADHSMIRRVMRKRAVGLTYGQRALVLGAVHPVLYVGTAENSAHRMTPYTRLALTGKLFEAVFLGSKQEADRALEFTRKKHVPVSGALPEDAGAHHPAGTAYSASNPYLMFMTMAFAFDSAEVMHDLLVRKLTAGEREGLYQDFVRWAELFGMPADAAPADYPAFRTYLDTYLASDELFLTDEARLVGSYLAGSRVPYPQRTPMHQVTSAFYLLVQGSLPARVRALYGMRWGLVEETAYRGLAQGIRTAHVELPLVPPLLRDSLAGPSAPLYRLVAERERKLARAGLPSMPGVHPESRAARNSA
ncbi:oxygenase MpaB family protein [Nocardia sp. NPDC050712]|uniref:oxygenase MpaB family protein n=1 Tax=Nocardia sp. NPDC050712 TaxID=3155518 RepID=UPI0033F088A7